jgi:monofunctional biosynthetic peptidoglycan transglycosylase
MSVTPEAKGKSGKSTEGGKRGEGAARDPRERGKPSSGEANAVDGTGAAGTGGRPVAGPVASLLGLILLGLVGLLIHQTLTWPDVEVLANRNPETTAFIERYRERSASEGSTARLNWRPVPYERISPHLKRAVLVAEDIGFFHHEGFAVEEIRTAIGEALAGEGRLRGASTITQQLAKNLWLSPSRNPLRKLKEAILTRQLEAHLSKRRILELYLNVVEFGPGIYGAEAASQRYFGTPASGLTEGEAARLAAVLPRPGSWHPHSESSAYRAQVERIEGWMRRAEFLWRYI